MAGTAPPFQAAHLGSLQRAPRPPSAAKTVDRPSIRDRQRSSRVRNRMREICTSGSVGGEDGDVLTYPADERNFRVFERHHAFGIGNTGLADANAAGKIT